jgi:hypothetical protein
MKSMYSDNNPLMKMAPTPAEGSSLRYLNQTYVQNSSINGFTVKPAQKKQLGTNK